MQFYFQWLVFGHCPCILVPTYTPCLIQSITIWALDEKKASFYQRTTQHEQRLCQGETRDLNAGSELLHRKRLDIGYYLQREQSWH